MYVDAPSLLISSRSPYIVISLKIEHPWSVSAEVRDVGSIKDIIEIYFGVIVKGHMTQEK